MILTLPPPMTSAVTLRLYGNPERTGTPTEVPVLETAGVWSADTADLTGRFWLTLVGTDEDLDVVIRNVDYADLPEDLTLVVSPEAVAVKAKVPLPLSAVNRETIIESIRDAQADVEAYLGRPVVPTTYVESDRYAWPDGWDLNAHGDEPIVRIVSAVPLLDGAGQPSNYFTVTYIAGIDARTDPALRPIRRFITAHAMNSPEFTALWKATVNPAGDLRSLSAEGQSVSFTTPTLGGGGKTGSGDPGALPSLASLDRWRVAGRRVYQGRTRTGQWPYSGAGWL